MSPWASGRSRPGDRFQQPKVVWRPEAREHGSRMMPPGSPGVVTTTDNETAALAERDDEGGAR